MKRMAAGAIVRNQPAVRTGGASENPPHIRRVNPDETIHRNLLFKVNMFFPAKIAVSFLTDTRCKENAADGLNIQLIELTQNAEHRSKAAGIV